MAMNNFIFTMSPYSLRIRFSFYLWMAIDFAHGNMKGFFQFLNKPFQSGVLLFIDGLINVLLFPIAVFFLSHSNNLYSYRIGAPGITEREVLFIFIVVNGLRFFSI